MMNSSLNVNDLQRDQNVMSMRESAHMRFELFSPNLNEN